MQKWEHRRTLVFWHGEEWRQGDRSWTEKPTDFPDATQTWKRGWYYDPGGDRPSLFFTELNELDQWFGQEGWELVSVAPAVTGYSAPQGGEIKTNSHWLYFKRPLPG